MLRNRIYYSVKPFVPRPFRTAIRRRFALRLRDRCLANWPIMPGSERAPEGWGGWPEAKKFALVLTHDVEGNTGLQKCQELARLERELGFRSSFNFIPEGDYRVRAKLREDLARDGFEVGVHDLRHDGRLYQSRRHFSRRAQRINEYLQKWNASGFRSGFMLHNLDWLHELRIKYDMSTFDTDPFEPQPDGRHTIFPFIVPRSESLNGQALTSDRGYVELPYTLPQDSTLFLLLRESTPDVWLRKLDWIAENGGMVLLNTHPDYMSFGGRRLKSMEYPSEYYKQLLDYARSNYSAECWHALPGELATFMLDQSNPRSQNQVQNALSAQDNFQAVNFHSRAFAVNGEALTQSETNVRLPSPSRSEDSNPEPCAPDRTRRFRGKRGAVLLFSHYPADPRPRRAAEALAGEGATIDLICLQENRDQPRRENINGVNVLRVPLKRRRRGKISYAWQYSAFILTSFAYLAIRSFKRRYDFVHVHNMPDILVFSALVPKILGAKVFLDLHDPMPELMQAIFKLPTQSTSVRVLTALEKRSICFADCVFTVSTTFKEIFSARSCPPEKIRVVVNSPDERIFRFRPAVPRLPNNAASSKPYVILYHGSLVRRNGLDLAVDALEIARKSIPTAKLRVAGTSTSFLEEVMQSVRERELEESVEYLGPRNLEGIVEAINACDLGVVPNHRNSFTALNTPTRIFECLALGKPVIVPRTRGIQDYFGREDLIYFELGDAADLAEKIKYTYFHPSEVEQTVKRGQQTYLRHTWTSERSNLLNAFAELL